MSHLLESARTFMLNNARLLERRLFSYHFEQGGRSPVIAALLAYQNEDDGFGNALEPDKRTPSSQPIDQEIALRVLDDVGFDRAIAQQICDFLDPITTDEGGVPFVLPTVRDAPRAPWWNTETDDPPASLNPTASIAGLLHKYDFHHPWLDRATAFCWRKLDHLDAITGHDFFCISLFLEHVPDRARAKQVFDHVSALLLAGGHVAFDPQTPGYVFTPLHYAPTPDSICRSHFDDAMIEQHLEALAHQQQDDGGWPIAWPAISPACELEYRGVETLRVLKILEAYDYAGLS